MTTKNTSLTIAGITIKTDAEGRYCLNDLHRAAGGEERHAPWRFLRLDTTVELIDELQSTTSGGLEPVAAKAGRYGGTFVARELVFAYAMWVSPKFHLEVIRAYDRLATDGVAVHKNAAEDLLANPLKYLEALMGQAKKLADENAQLAAEKLVLVEEKAVLQPKADTFDLVVAHKRLSVAAFCRTLPGVNIMRVKESLKRLGYLYRTGGAGTSQKAGNRCSGGHQKRWQPMPDTVERRSPETLASQGFWVGGPMVSRLPFRR